MNDKMRKELVAVIDENIHQTDYINMSLEDIRAVLIRQGFGVAEANILSASVKYIIGLRNYEKPTLTPVQKQRVCDYWSHVRSLDTLIGVWGDMSMSQIYHKMSKIKIYNREYIDYIVHSNPDITYKTNRCHDNNYGSSIVLVKADRLVDILYKDYLNMKEEIGYDN